LQVSVPVVGYVNQDSLVYYRAFVPAGEKSLVITCNSLSGGDPDLYVKKGHNRPTIEYYDYSSAGYRSD